jgi:hypothetical protein
MSIILLALVTMVAIYTSRTVLFENKISANDFRSRQAFEAAESGVEVALAYLGSVGGEDKDDDGLVDPVFDLDADGIGDSASTSFADGSSVTVSITGTFPSLTIQSVGVSDDGTATRLVRSTSSVADTLPSAPENPLTARGTVIVNGSASVFNPEGSSTIWSGSDVELGSNNSTATEIADPTDAGYPGCMDVSMTCGTVQSSNKVAVGLDVVEHDSSLSNLTAAETFENFFGMSMANYQASRVTLEVAAADVNNSVSNTTNPGVQLAVGEVVWIDGNTTFSNNTTVGCSVEVTGNNFCPSANVDPSIVIINGDLDATGTPNITGLLFVIGNFNLSGNSQVEGAVVATGDLTNATGGSLDVWYNSDVLEGTRNNGALASAPGSWQDW